MRPATSSHSDGHPAPGGQDPEQLELPLELLDDKLRGRLFLDALLDAAPSSIYFKDRNSRIIEASLACAHGFALEARGDTVGKSDFELLPSAAESTAAEEREIMRTGIPLLNQPEHYWLEDGTEVRALTSKLPLRDSSGEIVGTFGITREVERIRAGEVRKTTERLSSVVALQRAAASELDLESVMALVCRQAQDLMPAHGAAVLLVDEGELRCAAGTSAMAKAVERRLPFESSLAKEVLACGEALEYSNLDELHFPDCDLAREFWMRSLVMAPLLHGETEVGVLVAYSEYDHAFREEDARTLDLLAVVLSAAASHAAEWDAKQGELTALTQFRTMFEAAPIGIIKIDAEGRIVAANPMAQRMLGYTGAELEQMTCSDITHPDDLPESDCHITAAVEGRIDTFQLEKRLVRRDGDVIFAHVTTAAERGAGGTFLINMMEDVSERKRSEEQLRQAQKIEAIGQLTAGIAHDFNNLLMGVLGYAGLARAELDPGGKAAKYVERIEATGQRAASLTRQLLAFGRRQTLQACEVDVNRLINETVSIFHRLLGEQITIRTNLEPGLWAIEADPTQLQQVLLNLALNARDAMPSGGELGIETANVVLREGRTTAPSPLAPGRYVVLSVTDTGEGMSKEVQERIFEPFFTTKEAGEGTGLGLASVHGIVKQSLGDIEVESSPGNGATFRIILPAIA